MLNIIKADFMEIFNAKISLAGKTILIKTNNKKLNTILKSYFPEFSSKKKPNLTIEYIFKEGNFDLNLFIVKDEWRSKEKIKETKKNLFLFKHKKGKNGMLITGYLDLNRKKSKMKIISDKNFFWGAFVFNFAKCISIYFNEFNANLIHSAAIAEKNKGFMFIGKNNAGKSTILRICPEALNLGEDLNILFKKEKKFFIQAFPFIMMITAINKKNSQPVEIQNIFFLKKSKELKLKKLRKTDAITLMLENDIQGTFNFQQIKTEKRILLYHKLFSEISAFKINFPLEKKLWKKIKKELKKQKI